MTEKSRLTIRQVRAVSAVAAHASLAEAAVRLNISQSSLSRHVAEAERAVGRRLFQRGWAGMEPTSEGEVVIAHCRRSTAIIEDAQKAVGPRGTRVADLGSYLTWDLLRIADAVLACGGVSAAARSLEVSQAEVSRAIGRLAAGVGRPLFRRTRTGMAATEDAFAMSRLHGRLVAEMARVPGRLAALAGEMTGRVSVGLLPFSEQDAVSKAFGEMLSRHKHVRLQAVTGSYVALIDGLRRGELDFVLGLLRRPPPSETLEEIGLLDEAFAVVVRAGHPFAEAVPSLADLARENWIVAPHDTPARRYFEEWLLGEGITPPVQTCEIVTFFLAEQLILHSDAVGLLTYSDRKRAALGDGLKVLPIRLADSVREVGLTVRRHRRLTDAQEAFVAILSREWGRCPDRRAVDGPSGRRGEDPSEGCGDRRDPPGRSAEGTVRAASSAPARHEGARPGSPAHRHV